ncbi:preprotein translocase subunit YajC [Eubacterium pyruvativorans]|uniref:preprotein translocase subunit YajC n=1 Tax=Eubacterium pyruvativorans TaxID=155865 RepID=UPI0023EFCE9E|nr:preprotein translocase subunit YajC [Eubacterium pyruvativorans]
MLNQSILLAKAQSNATGGFMSFGILIVFIVIMYFFMIRPQRKKDKETQEMRNAIKVGDDIITIGGIVGKVVKVREESLIAVGADKVKFEVMKWSVSTVLGAGEKASEKKSAASREEKAEEEKNGKKNSIRILKKKEDEEAQTPEQPAEKEEK